VLDAARLERLAAAILPDLGQGSAVVSPFNVAAALALLAPGARGATAAELADVLGHDPAGALRGLTTRLEGLEGTEAVGPTAAWISRALAIEPEYRGAIADDLGGRVSAFDFRDPGAAAERINRWVSRATRERIGELVSADDLDPELARLVLTAALFLRAAWVEPLTRIGPRPFTLATGEAVEREFMARRTQLDYAEGPGWQAVRLDYGDRVTGLDVVLPDDLEDFEADLAANLGRVRAGMRRTDVRVELPPFSVRTRAELGADLREAGLGNALSPAADLRGIADSEDLYVSAVIHAALIEVDENGTLAAAATAVAVRATAAPVPREPKLITVDRPFLFVLRGPDSVPLFVGRVGDPAP
jgi:serpin B